MPSYIKSPIRNIFLNTTLIHTENIHKIPQTQQPKKPQSTTQKLQKVKKDKDFA